MKYKSWSSLKFLLTGILGLASLVVMFSSCGSTKEITYMQGSFDTAKLSQAKIIDPIIQKGDILSIIVYSDNPDATKIYNQALITTSSSSSSSSSGGGGDAGSPSITGSSPTSIGYLVDENGNIEFQGLGLIHVDSLTRSTLRDTLNERLKPFLTNPYYNIRIVNRKYTMLGEVGKPGIYSIPGDQINLFEALGLAGDMTFYGRRDNVLFIRETNGKRQFARLDLRKPEILVSPYFYLQQNDIVIVEANKKKIVANDAVTTRNVSLIATGISIFAIIYTIFRTN
jgi:polysaccharide export outer membrane protein